MQYKQIKDHEDLFSYMFNSLYDLHKGHNHLNQRSRFIFTHTLELAGSPLYHSTNALAEYTPCKCCELIKIQ